MLQTISITQDQFPDTIAVIDGGLLEEVAPGMVAAFWLASEPDRFHAVARGHRRIFPSPQKMEVGTIFDLASVSKVFSTATLFALLVDRGWVNWDLPVRAVIPEYPFEGITTRHLLSHTSGLPAWDPLYERMKTHFGADHLCRVSIAERQNEMREMVMAIKPEAAPGSRAVYSDISFLMLGYLLERVMGTTLADAVERNVWRPMGLRTATYISVTRSVTEGVLENFAATENCPWRKGVIQGQVHDDNCWSMGGYAGHAGAFADAEDLMIFVRALFRGFVSKKTLTEAWRRVTEPAGCERTPGWDTPSGATGAVGNKFSSSTVGHLGFTGTSLWIDPEAGLAVTLLTNRVHPTRENAKIKLFRPRFHDALRRDLHRQGLCR